MCWYLNSALSRRIHLVDLMLDQIFLIEEKNNLTTVDSLRVYICGAFSKKEEGLNLGIYVAKSKVLIRCAVTLCS